MIWRLHRYLAVTAIVAWAAVGHAAVVHQYTFNDGTATDIAGSADGTLVGAAGIGGTGRLTTTAGGPGTAYLDLPNGIASAAAAGGTFGQFSFEVWAQANTTSNWAALVSLGGAFGEEDDTGTGATKDYFQLIPQNGANQLIRATTHAIGNGTEGFVDHSAALSTSMDQHLVVVVDQVSLPGTIDLYIDGAHVGQSAVADGLNGTAMTDNNNWLGRSQWNDANFDGSYDEFRIHNTALSATDVMSSFTTGPVPPPAIPLTPAVTINRDSGSIMLQNGQTPSQVVGYVIQSEFGSLDQAGWSPITDNTDAPTPGDGSFDDDDQWSILTAPGSHTDLSEFELQGGDGGLLGAGEFLTISPGGAWIPSPAEEVTMQLKLDDGSTIDVDVLYTGNNDTAWARSDLDFDGDVDELDWPTFSANHRVDLSTFSLAEAYGRGDLDGDGDNDHADFLLFQLDFDAANGPGALAALIAGPSVPEPSSYALLAGAAAAAWAARRRSRRLAAVR